MAEFGPGLTRLLKDLNKKHGDGTVLRASEIATDVIPRITSGSLAVDMVLGGGWPLNQAVEVVGEASNGKTALALKTIAANQAANPEFTAVWVAAEEWVPGYAVMCGVDLDRVIVLETNVMESAYQAIIDFAETKEVDMIVLDSLPALIPAPENDKPMDEMTVGRGALLTNKFFRKVGKSLKRSLVEEERGVLLMVINQYRQLIGVMYGPDKTTPGGQGKDYAFFIRVEVKRDSWIEVGPSGNKTKVGQGIRVRTIKNKTAPSNRTAYLDFYFDGGGEVPAGEFDWGKEIVALASIGGILERKGAWYYYGESKWQGADAVLESVREDLDLRDLLEREVRALPMMGAS